MLRTNEQREKMIKDGIPQEGLIVGKRSGRRRVREKSRGRSKFRKGKKQVKCYKYNEIGHFQRDCPLLKNKKGENRGSNSLSMVAD